MNLTPKNKVILVAVGVVLVVVVLVVALIVPRWQATSDLDTRIAEADQEYTLAQSLLTQRRSIRDEAAVTDAGLIQLANAVPENPELPSLVIELQDLAYRLREDEGDDDQGVLLRSVTPGAPAASETGEYVVIPVEVEIFGTWDDTADYLTAVAGMVRKVRIVQFDASVLDEQTADQADLETPPYYYVRTLVQIEAYVIPASDQQEQTAPAATPPAN